MEKIVFSWNNAIPQVVKNIRDTVVYAVGLILPFSAFLSEKLGLTIEDFATICGIVIVAIKVVAKFFGVSDVEMTQKPAAPNDIELKNGK